MKSATTLITEERQRQVMVKGFTAAHDDLHKNDELAKAAACYAVAGTSAVVMDGPELLDDAFPWDPQWDKRDDVPRIRALVMAGALIAAEIDRLQREAGK